MTYVRTFENFAPPSRADGVPFTKAIIKENAVATYSTAITIDTLTFADPDSDPSNPKTRTLTTANATIEQNGWYWIVWEDANGAQFIAQPVQTATSTLSRIETLVRSEMPLTWDALVGDAYLGIATMRMRIANVKAVLLPDVLAGADEDSYSDALAAYVSKSAAYDLIPSAIEYWMRQKTSISATGTNETKSMPDPIVALNKLAERLAAEIARLAGNINIVQFLQVPTDGPALSGDGDPITEDPYEWLPAFGTGTGTAA